MGGRDGGGLADRQMHPFRVFARFVAFGGSGCAG